MNISQMSANYSEWIKKEDYLTKTNDQISNVDRNKNSGKSQKETKLEIKKKFEMDNESLDGGSSEDDDDDEFGEDGTQDLDFGMDDENLGRMRSSSDELNLKSSSNKKSTEMYAKAKNREHAKNTRIRKKNYIESLKETIKHLSEEREKTDKDRKAALSKLADQAMERKKVLQTLFYFRATGEMNPTRWRGILEENFELVMPITPYRTFPPSEVIDGQRHVKGISGIILDTASLHVMLQSIGQPKDDDGKVIVQYFSGPTESIMSNNTFICKWQMTTVNAIERGSRYEITKQGMIKANFSENNKLTYMEHAFDVMSYMQQLRRASGKYDFHVIPNTPLLAQDESSDARVITEASPPYIITYVNQNWCEMFGIPAEKAVGRTCSIVQGELTDVEKRKKMMMEVENCLPSSAILINYTADGVPFKNWIRIFPLYHNNRVTHFLGLMEKIESLIPENLRINNSAGHIHKKSSSSCVSETSNRSHGTTASSNSIATTNSTGTREGLYYDRPSKAMFHPNEGILSPNPLHEAPDMTRNSSVSSVGFSDQNESNSINGIFLSTNDPLYIQSPNRTLSISNLGAKINLAMMKEEGPYLANNRKKHNPKSTATSKTSNSSVTSTDVSLDQRTYMDDQQITNNPARNWTDKEKNRSNEREIWQNNSPMLQHNRREHTATDNTRIPTIAYSEHSRNPTTAYNELESYSYSVEQLNSEPIFCETNADISDMTNNSSGSNGGKAGLIKSPSLLALSIEEANAKHNKKHSYDVEYDVGTTDTNHVGLVFDQSLNTTFIEDYDTKPVKHLKPNGNSYTEDLKIDKMSVERSFLSFTETNPGDASVQTSININDDDDELEANIMQDIKDMYCDVFEDEDGDIGLLDFKDNKPAQGNSNNNP